MLKFNNMIKEIFGLGGASVFILFAIIVAAICVFISMLVSAARKTSKNNPIKTFTYSTAILILIYLFRPDGCLMGGNCYTGEAMYSAVYLIVSAVIVGVLTTLSIILNPRKNANIKQNLSIEHKDKKHLAAEEEK